MLLNLKQRCKTELYKLNWISVQSEVICIEFDKCVKRT